MNRDLKDILKVGCMYATSVIGAGFASGQEIMQFFSDYHKGGFFGIILSGLLFSLVGMIVLDKVYKERITDYDEFLFPVTGWFLGWIIEIAVTLFMVSVFCVMTSGMATIVCRHIPIPFFAASAGISLICMILILTDLKGLVLLSSIITPALFAGILAAGIFLIVGKEQAVFNMNIMKAFTNNWFFSALLYVSYNSLMSVVILSNMLPYLKTRKTGLLGGLIGGMILCLMSMIINLVLSIFYPGIHSELPLLSLLQRYSGIFVSLYTAVLFGAMLTSAVSSGFCIIGRISQRIKAGKRLITALMCGIAIPMSTIGFSNLISALYPVFGYIGLFLVFVILLTGVRELLHGWIKK